MKKEEQQTGTGMGKSESTKPFTTVADAANDKKDAPVTAFTDHIAGGSLVSDRELANSKRA